MPPFEFYMEKIKSSECLQILPVILRPMSYEEASQAVADHVTSIFQLNLNENLLYHNFEHTSKVVARGTEIALFYQLDDEKLFIIRTSAWFHDIGYLFTGPKDHEREAVRLMEQFIPRIISKPPLHEIAQCIMATKRSVYPESVLEKIMCDADTFHFGTTEFRQTDPLIKKEIELWLGTVQTEWISHSIKMLRNHQFYTSYCKERLDEGKERNIEWLQSML